MTKQDCEKFEPGMKLRVGTELLYGDDDDARKWLGNVITFSRFDGFKWVYYEECPDSPFHFEELVGVEDLKSIDDESIPYDIGNIDLIFWGCGSGTD